MWWLSRGLNTFASLWKSLLFLVFFFLFLYAYHQQVIPFSRSSCFISSWLSTVLLFFFWFVFLLFYYCSSDFLLFMLSIDQLLFVLVLLVLFMIVNMNKVNSIFYCSSLFFLWFLSLLFSSIIFFLSFFFGWWYSPVCFEVLYSSVMCVSVIKTSLLDYLLFFFVTSCSGSLAPSCLTVIFPGVASAHGAMIRNQWTWWGGMPL